MTALKWGSCASDIYHLLWDKKHMTLHEMYDYLKSYRAQSSIRRSLYELRDQGLIYKVEPDTWWFDTEAKPVQVNN